MKCPRCGKEMTQKEMNGIMYHVCEDCRVRRKIISPSASAETATDVPSTVVPKKSHTKKWVIIALLCVFIFAIGIGGIFIFRHNQEQKEQEYIQSIKNFSTEVLLAAASCEDVCNLTQAVWYNTIWEKSDTETDKFTKVAGEFRDDFNDSLVALFSDSDYTNDLNSIEIMTESIDQKIIKLADYPASLQKYYDASVELYKSYKKFANLAASPSGSLESYREDFSNYDSDTLDKYDDLETLLDLIAE